MALIIIKFYSSASTEYWWAAATRCPVSLPSPLNPDAGTLPDWGRAILAAFVSTLPEFESSTFPAAFAIKFLSAIVI